MNNLYCIFTGKVKFQQSKQLANGSTLVSYLISCENGRGKTSTITVKQFEIGTPVIYPKDTQIECTGWFEENRYMDHEGNWKSNGLQFIASEVKEVKQ